MNRAALVSFSGGSQMWRLIVIAVACAGCMPDLQRVHSPDLLVVDPRMATKHRAGPLVQEPNPTVTPRENWQIHSSLWPREALVDQSQETQAVAPDPASKIQYVLVDLGEMCLVRQVTQIHGEPNGYPRRYRIDIAGEHNFPYFLSFVGEGAGGKSVASFRKPAKCRFLRITLLETADQPWNIAELTIE